jgi:hypothetical protein
VSLRVGCQELGCNFLNLRPLFVARHVSYGGQWWQKIYISYLTARKTDHTAAIYFYQHFVPNGTKIERKYFYVNITM